MTFFIGGLLLKAAVVDVKKHEIPDSVSIAIVLCGAIQQLVYGRFGVNIFPSIALLLLLTVMSIFLEHFDSSGLGGGDIKLIAALTFFGGLPMALLILLVGCFGGAVFILLCMVIQGIRKQPCGVSAIAMAPFFLMGYIVCNICLTKITL